jgi:hypothetical protein
MQISIPWQPLATAGGYRPSMQGEVGDADAVNKGVSGDEGELSPFAQSGSRVGLRSIMSRGQKRENGWRGRLW